MRDVLRVICLVRCARCTLAPSHRRRRRRRRRLRRRRRRQQPSLCLRSLPTTLYERLSSCCAPKAARWRARHEMPNLRSPFRIVSETTFSKRARAHMQPQHRLQTSSAQRSHERSSIECNSRHRLCSSSSANKQQPLLLHIQLRASFFFCSLRSNRRCRVPNFQPVCLLLQKKNILPRFSEFRVYLTCTPSTRKRARARARRRAISFYACSSRLSASTVDRRAYDDEIRHDTLEESQRLQNGRQRGDAYSRASFCTNRSRC